MEDSAALMPPTSVSYVHSEFSDDQQPASTSQQHPYVLRLQLSGPTTCSRCKFEIQEKHLLRVIDDFYHEHCLRCTCCNKLLGSMDSCFVRNGQVLCKDDHLNFFSPKCSRCLQPLQPNDYVQRSRDHTFHTHCFHCVYCGLPLRTGDQYFCIEGQIVCQQDYAYICHPPGTSPPGGMVPPVPLPPPPPVNVPGVDASGYGTPPMVAFYNDVMDLSSAVVVPQTGGRNRSSSKKPPKRPRTILNSQQRRAFKIAFEKGPKPSRKVRELLAKETGLSVRVVQVWFQNQRAKIKKIQRKQDQVQTNSVDSDPKSADADDDAKSTISGKSLDGSSGALLRPLSIEMPISDSESEDVDADADVDSGRSSSATLQRQESANSFYSGANNASEPQPATGDGGKELTTPIDKLYHLHSTYFAYV